MHSEPTEVAPAHPLYDGIKLASVESFGLRHNALSPLETLAQSISTIAPSTSPTLTIPLVFVLAGQGTAIAYLIAMGLMLLVGLCIAAFARESSSPGSLYVYTRRSLPPAFSAITALTLFFAYITTASGRPSSNHGQSRGRMTARPPGDSDNGSRCCCCCRCCCRCRCLFFAVILERSEGSPYSPLLLPLLLPLPFCLSF